MAVHLEKSGEDLQVEFPFVVATVPHKEPGGPTPDITYGQLAYCRRAQKSFFAIYLFKTQAAERRLPLTCRKITINAVFI